MADKRSSVWISRHDVLIAARDLFEERGFEGTTTDDVASAARIAKRSLYRHFSSKEQLLYELQENFVQALLQEARKLEGNPEQRLRRMVASHIQVLRDHRREVKVFLEEAKHVGGTRRIGIMQGQQTYEQAFAQILQDGVDSGVFEIPDVQLACRAILGALNDGYRWYDDSIDDAEHVAAQFIRLIVSGIGARKTGRTELRLAPDVVERLRNASTSPNGELPADIVAAATHLFCKLGYHRTATQQIADRAGVTKGALFYHVKHKEELLVEIVRGLLDRYRAILDVGGAAHLPPPEKIASFLVGQSYAITLDREAVAVFVEELKYLPTEMLGQVSERSAAAYATFENALVEGVHAGAFDVSDPRLACLYATGTITFAYRWYEPEDGLTPEDFGLQIAELVLNGIGRRD
jgi:AcrR family transcriptional regulator